jgi:hypothetical protein
MGNTFWRQPLLCIGYGMLRDAIFRSGGPMLIATCTLLAISYVALLRRERVAAYWSVAWALLLARYFWAAYWGDPLPSGGPVAVSLVLRTGFAATVLAGVAALRGKQPTVRQVALPSLAVPLALVALEAVVPGTPRDAAVLTVLALTFGLLELAAFRLYTATRLPSLERRITAVALALYGVVTAVAPQLTSGGAWLGPVTIAGWGFQLCTAFGLLATFFRLSYDGEIAVRQQMERRLTAALGEFVSVCMHCKAVRDEQRQWRPLEQFVARTTNTAMSHGLCDSCANQHYKDEMAGAN